MADVWLAALSGLIGGGALLAGAVVAWFVDIPQRVVAAIMALGSGVLISTLAFELVEDPLHPVRSPGERTSQARGCVRAPVGAEQPRDLAPPIPRVRGLEEQQRTDALRDHVEVAVRPPV